MFKNFVSYLKRTPSEIVTEEMILEYEENGHLPAPNFSVSVGRDRVKEYLELKAQDPNSLSDQDQIKLRHQGTDCEFCYMVLKGESNPSSRLSCGIINSKFNNVLIDREFYINNTTSDELIAEIPKSWNDIIYRFCSSQKLITCPHVTKDYGSVLTPNDFMAFSSPRIFFMRSTKEVFCSGNLISIPYVTVSYGKDYQAHRRTIHSNMYDLRFSDGTTCYVSISGDFNVVVSTAVNNLHVVVDGEHVYSDEELVVDIGHLERSVEPSVDQEVNVIYQNTHVSYYDSYPRVILNCSNGSAKTAEGICMFKTDLEGCTEYSLDADDNSGVGLYDARICNGEASTFDEVAGKMIQFELEEASVIPTSRALKNQDFWSVIERNIISLDNFFLLHENGVLNDYNNFNTTFDAECLVNTLLYSGFSYLNGKYIATRVMFLFDICPSARGSDEGCRCKKLYFKYRKKDLNGSV